MLHLVLGRIGCGKTTYAHQLLKERAQSGCDDMLLIVPEQFTYESDKGVVETLGAAGASRVNVVSFKRLATKIFDAMGYPDKPMLDECAKAVFMAMALESIEDRIKVYSRHTDSSAFISSLLELGAELKQCSVTPENLRQVCAGMPEGVLRQKGLELSLIYEAYDSLVTNSFFDSETVLDRLAVMLDKTDRFIGGTVVVDGFRRFTAQEMRIIEKLLVRAKDVYVTLCTEDVHAESVTGAFSAAGETAQKLIRLASKLNVPVGSPVRLTDEKMGFSTYADDALRYLEKNLYLPDADAFDGETENITVCCAGDIQEECAWVAREIKRLMRSGFCRCRDIAVVFRSGDTYEKEINYALKKHGVPMFEDNRQPITNQPLINLVRNVLEISCGGYSTDTVMRCMKTSLAGLDIDECFELENYVLMWGITGKAWLSEWTYNPDGFGVEMSSERQARLDELNRLRLRFVEPIENFKHAARDADGKTVCTALYNYLLETGADERLKKLAVSLEENGEIALAIEQQQVWDMLMQLLDKMAVAVDSYTLSLRKITELFVLAVSSQTLGRIPAGFDETVIGSAARIQTRGPKVVFVLGMNDGVFPKAPSSAGLFTDSERLMLESLELELAKNSRTKVLDERFMVYNSVCSARQKLFVSYSCSDISGARLAKSEVVENIEALFPRCRRVETATIPDEEKVEAARPAFELMAANYRNNNTLFATLKEYFSNIPEYSGKLAALQRAAEKREFRISDEKLARKLFGEKMHLSASRIEVYENCAFRYFCQYGLYARPRADAKLDPAQEGKVIHYVLENLLKKYGGKGLSRADTDELVKDIKSLIDVYADEFMGGLSDKEKRFLYQFEKIARAATVVVMRISKEFENSQFEPCDFELHIGGDGPVKEYTVELPDGRSSAVIGFIDRVDKMELDGKTYLRVVDYKSGGKEFALSDVFNGLNMQMLIYLFALWKNGGEYYGSEIVPSGVLYLPANFRPYDVSRHEDIDTVRSKMLANGKMNGMILDDEKVYVGMDSELSGIFVPIKRDSHGKIKGTLISIEQLVKLKQKTDGILRDMVKQLHHGRIDARPVFGKNHDKTCEYCDFASVCCHEKNDGYRYVEFLNHSQCLAKLGGEEGEEDGERVDS